MPDATAPSSRHSWLVSSACTGSSVVLTASRRLARTLREHYNANMRNSGYSAWPTPHIHFWKDWLRKSLVDAGACGDRRMLSAAASLVLWEGSLRKQLDEPILSVARLARQAAATWQTLLEWQVPHEAVIRSARSRDERAFAAAYDDFRRQLTQNGWMDAAELPGLGVDAVRNGLIAMPRIVYRCGFERVSPVVHALFEGLAGAGATVTAPDMPVAGGTVRSASFIDDDAELRSVGGYTRSLLTSRPDVAMGIVVSDLEQDADRVVRLVREGFAPGWQSGSSSYTDAVEVSYGRRLAAFPAVAAALLWLRWPASGLRSAEVSVLLRSPFFSGGDADVVSILDLRLRRLPDREWRLPDLIAAIERDDDPAALRARFDQLRDLDDLGRQASERLSPTQLAETVDAILSRAGWPGHETLGSDEFQLVNRFRELINEFAGIGDVLGEITLGEGIRRLARMAGEAVFQPEGTGKYVQVLGPLEAAGMEFDELWVCRCDADRWPGASQPSSLVSKSLQIHYRMPDATPADTLDYSRTVLAQLAHSAPRVTFSWSRTDVDAQRLRTPLLDGLGAGEDSAVSEDPGWYANGLCALAELQTVAADPVPAVRGTERVAGGAGTVNLQWQEPFSAFAIGRLGVRELEAFRPGLNPGLRGSLLHDALRRLYADRPARSVVMRMSEEKRAQRVAAAVAGSSAKLRSLADPVFRRLLDLEAERMRGLLADVVKADLQRAPFRVLEVEKRMPFSHAGVELMLQADRIDLLEDDSLLIIDYKTGRVRNLIDKDGNPLDAQVFVYAAALQGAIGGLALMFVHRFGISYKALGHAIDWSPMERDQWETSLAGWQRSVLAAIEAIARGDVRVNVAADQLRRWQLNVLCRSAELRRDG